MLHLYPYVRFNGETRKAMTFYHQSLGGELTLQTVGESPMADASPPEMHMNIVHSSLVKDGAVLLYASDMIQPKKYKKGNAVSVCLMCENKEELETSFKKLAVGGKVTHPIKEEYFGLYGDLVDKFGVVWMFMFDAKLMRKEKDSA